uniref:BLUF domain-containing protein n=1 Tax=Haptolina brevifila TaxID=156173 RepID=A0A7S2D7K3_9EUKA|mmetsp:Transcript_34072/g.67851  ORF Transcript_34072/g.67851 Transcript_34072/m.67851 type:complete len:356 (+) Transcript_34072:138-1205(+)
MGGKVSTDAGSQSFVRSRTIFRVVYTSILNVATEAEAEKVISEIIAIALNTNPTLDITGCLYFDRTSRGIVQVLEGPHKAVTELYAQICADRRHHQCQIIEEKAADDEGRLFPGFGMALMRISETEKMDAIETIAKAHNASQLPGATLKHREWRFSRETAIPHLMRLQYSSVLRASSTEEGRRILATILQGAVSFNSRHGIGGLLAFNPSSLEVTQIIEGPASTVLELFDRISVDSRHHTVVLTSQELVLNEADIAFHSRWGMLQSDTIERTAQLVDLAARLRPEVAATIGAIAPAASSLGSESLQQEAKANLLARIRSTLSRRGSAHPSHLSVDSTPAMGEVVSTYEATSALRG